MTSLLPPNATTLERNIERTQLRYAPSRLIPTLWNHQTCPANMLPWLAASLSVDVWEESWPEETKRLAIANTIELHKINGSAGAIRIALDGAGHADATIVERVDYQLRDGTKPREGIYRRGGASRWATFMVILNRPTSSRWAEQIRKRIIAAKRNCCELVELRYSASSMVRDGTTPRDGTHLRGMI